MVDSSPVASKVPAAVVPAFVFCTVGTVHTATGVISLFEEYFIQTTEPQKISIRSINQVHMTVLVVILLNNLSF